MLNMEKNKSRYERIPVRTWFLKFNCELPMLQNPDYFQLWRNPPVVEYLRIYHQVGDLWGWTGRLLLSEMELTEKLNSADNEVWLFQPEGTAVGFFEIDFSVKGKAEIVYLGLIPSEIGKGYGKLFLNVAIATAGRKGSEVWLHTCEFDHPDALKIYQKAGFEIVGENIEEELYPIPFLEKHNRI